MGSFPFFKEHSAECISKSTLKIQLNHNCTNIKNSFEFLARIRDKTKSYTVESNVGLTIGMNGSKD